MANFQQSETALTESATLINIFAEKIRRQIIIALGNSDNGLNVTDITALVNISRPAVSHHLRLMREALSLIHISEPTRPNDTSRMPSSA